MQASKRKWPKLSRKKFAPASALICSRGLFEALHSKRFMKFGRTPASRERLECVKLASAFGKYPTTLLPRANGRNI